MSSALEKPLPRIDEGSRAKLPSRSLGTFILLASGYLVLLLLTVQGLVLTPLYLAHIPADLYGSWLALGNVVCWFALIHPNVHLLVSRNVAALHGGGSARGEIATELAHALTVAVLSLVVPLVLFIAHDLPAGWFPLPPEERAALAAALRWQALAIALLLLEAPFAAVVRGTQRQLAEGVTAVAGTVAGMSVTLVALLGGMGLVSLPMGLVAQAALTLGCSVFLARSWIDARLSWETLRKVRSGLGGYWIAFRPGFVTGLASCLRGYVSLLLAATFLSPRHAAVLGLTGQAYLVVARVIERTFTAPLPSLAHLAGARSRAAAGDVALGRVRPLVGFLTLVGAASVLALNDRFMMIWVGPDWYGGLALSAALALDLFVSWLFLADLELLFALGAVESVARIKLLDGTVRVLLQGLAVWRVGLWGIPLGGALATLVVRSITMPRLMRRNLALSSTATRKIEAMHALSALVILVLGGLGNQLAARLPSGNGWAGFVLAAILVGSGTALGGLPLFRSVPASLLRMVRRPSSESARDTSD